MKRSRTPSRSNRKQPSGGYRSTSKGTKENLRKNPKKKSHQAITNRRHKYKVKFEPVKYRIWKYINEPDNDPGHELKLNDRRKPKPNFKPNPSVEMDHNREGQVTALKVMDVFELVLKAEKVGAKPYFDGHRVEATFKLVNFNREDESLFPLVKGTEEKTEGEVISTISFSMRAFGFWDGDKTYRIRFTPLFPGTWEFETKAVGKREDRNLDGVKGTLIAEARTEDEKRANPLVRGFLTRASDHPKTKNQISSECAWVLTDGTPFLPVGDTTWPFIEEYKLSEFKEWMDALKELRLNTVLGIVWWRQSYTPHNSNFNRTGITAFQNDDPNEGRLNHKYFEDVDKKIHYANCQGVMAGLGIGGFPGNAAWFSIFSSESDKRWFRYITSRYAAFNVRWLLYGEADEGGAEWYNRASQGRSAVISRDPYKHPMGCHFTPIAQTDQSRRKMSWSRTNMDYLEVQLPGKRETDQYLRLRAEANTFGEHQPKRSRLYVAREGKSGGKEPVYALFGEGLAAVVPGGGSVVIRLPDPLRYYKYRAIDIRTGNQVSLKADRLRDKNTYLLTMPSGSDFAFKVLPIQPSAPNEAPAKNPTRGKPIWSEEYWYEPTYFDKRISIEKGGSRTANYDDIGILNTYQNFLAVLAFPTIGSWMRQHKKEGNSKDKIKSVFVPDRGSVKQFLSTKDLGLIRMKHFARFIRDLDVLNFRPGI